MNGNREAVRIIDFIQFLPGNRIGPLISIRKEQKINKPVLAMDKVLTTMARIHPPTHITRNEGCESIAYNESCDNCSPPEPHEDQDVIKLNVLIENEIL